jgi:TfoX/Sxy family transcriptional regulator of competence genes
MSYTSVNGHMFSFLTPSGSLALRLPEPDRSAFLDEHGAKPVEQHGHVLKEYVEVPEALFDDHERLRRYLARSHDHAGGLRPKQTRRSR